MKRRPHLPLWLVLEPSDLGHLIAQHNQQVRAQLRQQVKSLRRPHLKHLIAHLLNFMGYTDVRLLQRTWGRSGDILASTKIGLTLTQVIVQVKKYASPVHRHVVDELRGTVLRASVQHGLLVTLSTFSRVARQAATGDSRAPITLLDGEQLLDLLIKHQLGVHRDALGLQAIGLESWRLDESFLQRLKTSRATGSNQQLLSYDGFADIVGSPSNQAIAAPQDGTGNQRTVNGHNKVEHHKGGGMTWRTHALSGIGSLWLLNLVPGAVTASTIAPLVVIAALSALLPDLDAAQSKVKYLRVAGIRPFAPLAVVLHRGLGHRGLLHSLLGLSVIAILSLYLAFWWGWSASLALLLGYLAHLAGDACTKSGIPWLYPNKQRFHLLPPAWRFVTGSAAEGALFPFLFAAVGFLLLSVAVSVATGYPVSVLTGLELIGSMAMAGRL